MGSLILGKDDKFYGLTKTGGTYNYGTVFSFNFVLYLSFDLWKFLKLNKLKKSILYRYWHLLKIFLCLLFNSGFIHKSKVVYYILPVNIFLVTIKRSQIHLRNRYTSMPQISLSGNNIFIFTVMLNSRIMSQVVQTVDCIDLPLSIKPLAESLKTFLNRINLQVSERLRFIKTEFS